jgi:hypothetical protein
MTKLIGSAEPRIRARFERSRGAIDRPQRDGSDGVTARSWMSMLWAISWEGAARLKFLVDTNILIAIEPVQTELESTASIRLSSWAWP